MIGKFGDLKRQLSNSERIEGIRNAVREKVEALYPAHEIEEFTDLFWGRIQRWRAEQEAAS